MAELMYPNIGASFREGQAFGTQQRLQREGEERRNKLATLASQAYSTAPDQQQSLLGQIAAVSPEAAAQQSQQFESMEDRRNKTLANMARTLVGVPPQARAGLYQRMLPSLQQFGLSDLPPAYDAQTAPLIDKTANAIVQASMGAQGIPSGFRELDMTAQAAGYTPGTPEYQQAAQVALGMRGRAATGGFGFKEITGADGRTRWARQNPRTGTMEIYDETTGEFVPLGGGAPLNPGGAPAAVPQAAPQAAPGGGSSASNLGSPITMPTDLNTAFASLSNSFPGTQITSTTRTPEHNREVGGVANSQHLRGTAADFAVPAAQRPAFIEAARRQGFEAIDEGDHVHLELPPGARAPVARPGLGVSRTPEEQAALTTAAQEQAKINAEMGAYAQMTGLEAERAGAVEGAKVNAKAGAERIDAQRTKSDALRVYEAGIRGLTSGLAATETGPLIGRLPAVTSGQQIAEGGVAAMAPILKQIFRTAGEGTFTDADQKLLLAMVPTRTDTPTARKAKLANIDTIVRAKLGSGPSTPAAPGAPSAPRAGTVQDGYRFRGGNPADPNAWERI